MSAVFIAICMMLIAACVGVVVYLSFGFTGMEASTIAIAALTAMVMVNSVTGRARDRSDVGAYIADLSRGTADMARKVSELDRRMIAIEGEVAVTLEQARTIAAPLGTEIGELGSLVKDLADAVAAHEQMLDDALANVAPARPAAAPLPAPSSERLFAPDPMETRGATVEPEAVPARKPATAFRGLDQAEINSRLARAIEANRIEMFLQPIVTLPQRKVRYYEALGRLRMDDGALVASDEFSPHAAAAGLLPAIDNLMVFRCVQVVRRLSTKNREVGLFCTLSADTFAHAKLFKELTDFLEANRVIAPYLVFQFAQEAVRALGPIEEECVASLADLGFRFAMDNVVDLRMEPRELSDRGFRFIKAPAALLLNRATGSQGDIHPADFSDLLGRFGIDLIADSIDSESTVVDLLDYDVRFGQGTLFSPPRPVRTEVLQGLADRPPQPTRPAERPAPAEAPSDTRLPPRATALGQLARGIAARRAQG